MSTLPGLTSFLWWMMLLSATAIILYDIVGAIPRKINQVQGSAANGRLVVASENEIETIANRIRRSVQRPQSFRLLRREIAETIMSSALAAKGLPPTRTISHQLILTVLRDIEVGRYVEETLAEKNQNRIMGRGEILAEFERMTTVLDKAARELV